LLDSRILTLLKTKLQLHFEFVRMINDEKKSLDRIWIYRNDSLVLQLENQDYLNDSLYTWEFPSIPDGLRLPSLTVQ
jgi:hypothetical protein